MKKIFFILFLLSLFIPLLGVNAQEILEPDPEFYDNLDLNLTIEEPAQKGLSENVGILETMFYISFFIILIIEIIVYFGFGFMDNKFLPAIISANILSYFLIIGLGSHFFGLLLAFVLATVFEVGSLMWFYKNRVKIISVVILANLISGLVVFFGTNFIFQLLW